MQSKAIEIFYLFFQGILIFQVLIFLILYFLSRRMDILYYSLFLFFAAAYFFLNAPYTFFGIPEDAAYWNSYLYTHFNTPLIIVENLFYLLFLKAFFEDITNDIAVLRVVRVTLWLIPVISLLYVFLLSMGWNTDTIYFTVQMISVLPAAIVVYVIVKKMPPFANLVANGLICTIVGTTLTVIMIIIGNNGYTSLFTVYYTLFFIRLGILGDMIFYLVAILKKWHFQEKQLALEKIRSEFVVQQFRNKISGELHDDLGSSLSGIAMYSHLANESFVSGQYAKARESMEYIQKSVSEVITNLSEIVWTINPGNDKFENVLSRMRNFAFEMLGAKNIDFQFDADEDVINMNLPMETRKNLYLVFKEAVNNLVKYSGTDKAFFSLTSEKNQIVLIIQDHGKGFHVNASSNGNGMTTIRKRAKEMNADLDIRSEVKKGTVLKLTIPV